MKINNKYYIIEGGIPYSKEEYNDYVNRNKWMVSEEKAKTIQKLVLRYTKSF